MRLTILALGALVLGGLGLAQAAPVPTSTQATAHLLSDAGATTVASTTQQQPKSRRHMQKKQKTKKMKKKHTSS
jgi:hypothetical protein